MIEAHYFDGRSAQARVVRLTVQGDELVAESTVDGSRRWPLAQVRWPETTRHGRRVVHLADGSSLEATDAAAFDAWRRGIGAHDGWVVRLQQSWRGTLVALTLLAATLAATYLWAVPLAARGVVALLPPSADRAVGDAAWSSIASRWLKPSALPAERQQVLREQFAAAVARTHPADERPTYTLRFQAADPALGPNAFALPGGTIVVTDALVELLADRTDTLLGVLGHELGHVRLRHGMRALAQVTLLSAASSLVIGDFSSLLAGVPALVGQLGYSRDAEREADHEAVQLLRAQGHSPAAMVVLFERLRSRRGATTVLPMALASHPADDERVAYFENAAARR